MTGAARLAAGTGATRRAYLRTEIAISVVINMVLSLAFFLLVFGLARAVPVAGPGGYAVDFLPQSFMIALMSTLVPGAIAAARIRRGRIRGDAGTTAALLRRSALTAVVAALAGGVIALLLLGVMGDTMAPLVPALLAKIIYGGVLAAIVTPIGLARVLRSTELS